MNEVAIWIIFLLLITVLVQLLNIKTAMKNDKNTKINIKDNNYSIKNIMTNYEKYFYDVLVELEDELGIKIHPQVNLATILKKENNNYYINELFKNIDFGIFSKDYNKLYLLIEINDNTHNSKKRKNRDEKVDQILGNAGIKLIKFYSKYPNKKDYVKFRIKNEILDLIQNN